MCTREIRKDPGARRTDARLCVSPTTEVWSPLTVRPHRTSLWESGNTEEATEPQKLGGQSRASLRASEGTARVGHFVTAADGN